MTTKDRATLAMELDAAVLGVAQAAQELTRTSEGLGEARSQGGFHQLVDKGAYGDLQDAVKAWRSASEALVQSQRRK
jgi:hypothetical protein